MARKPKHFTTHTVAETDAAFQDVIAAIRGRFDAARSARLHAIAIDGTPIGDGHAALRGPNTSAYAQVYLEASCVAGMLVELDLDFAGVNLVTGDKPDLTVTYTDRDAIFIEQTMVTEYDGTPFYRHLEEINVALEERRATDEPFRRKWEAGMLTVRMTDPGVSVRRDRAQTVEEIAALAPGLPDEVRLLRPTAREYPALHTYAASVFYHAGKPRNWAICTVDGGFVDPRPLWVSTRLRAAVADKRGKATGYDPSAKPLWLLLNLDGPHLIPRYVRELAEDALGRETLAPFDRIVVSYPGLAPIVFE